jgi:2-oxoisovalerate ferredoxin oxidoreductase beta subunit
MMGEPLRMSEMIAGISGSIYVERVALFNNKERVRAQKAIHKALRLQVENKGFAFVEVLSECPTHLHMTPEDAEKWVQEKMVPVFPLGVKKDLEGSLWFQLKKPNFEPGHIVEVLDASRENVCRYASGFPDHIADDIAIKFAGAGGDGAQTAAMLLTHAALDEGFDATHIPSYGPESRGGTSYADVHIAREEVLSPAVPHPHILVAFNSPSLHKFGPEVVPGGSIFYDDGVVAQVPPIQEGVKLYAVPFGKLAAGLGKAVVKNIVALGALQGVTGILPEESFLDTLHRSLKEKPEWHSLNEQAFKLGKNYVSKSGVTVPR